MRQLVTGSTVTIRAQADQAWAFLADYANDPLWRGDVQSMAATPVGPVQQGTTAIEVLSVWGQRVTTSVVIESVTAGRGFAWRATDGPGAFGTRTVEPRDARSCQLTTNRTITLAGAQRLVGPLLRRALQRAEERDLARAARLIEAHAASL